MPPENEANGLLPKINLCQNELCFPYIYGVGVAVGLGLDVGEISDEGVVVGVRVAGVGVTKIILMAELSGIGETTFLPLKRAPIIIIINIIKPMIIVMAANVF